MKIYKSPTVIRIDENLRSVITTFPPLPSAISYSEMLNILKAGTNVGDYVIIPIGTSEKVFKRVKGGWVEANEQDVAKILAAEVAGEKL